MIEERVKGVDSDSLSKEPGGLNIGSLPAPTNLTLELVRALSTEIRSGKLKAGDRLPTEQELMRQAGVSRTVVREAVSALRAEGLVVTRQGLGAFVAATSVSRPFRIDLSGADASDFAQLEQILHVMELRIGIEVEAAGLAAERRSTQALTAIEQAAAAFEAAVRAGDSAVSADFGFHKRIFEATGNAYFPRFLTFLGEIIIPRQSVPVDRKSPTQRRAYLERVMAEHVAVLDAIRNGSATEARTAMRRHLSNGRDRYRRMAEALKQQDGGNASDKAT
jgi:DNA-binding FadR family transcriptional regulator